MKRFLYPLVATALITIAPFLLTFEKGQDIVRGLFALSILALLLLFTFIKEQPLKIKGSKTALLGLVALLVLGVAWIDLQNILLLQNRSTGYFAFIPLITTFMALLILKPIQALSMRNSSLFLFLFFVAHLVWMQFSPSQPLAEFPIIKSLSNTSKTVQRDSLPSTIKEEYLVIDTATITARYIDSSKSNVAILVESWGVPLDTESRQKAFQIFDDFSVIKGIHSRVYSRTRTAEREDLLLSWTKNGSKRDSVFIPQVMSQKQVKTKFFFGGDSTVQNREDYIRNMGFEEAFFFPSGASDSLMLSVIDSTLALGENEKQFIAWTTRDTRFPIPGDVSTVEKVYYDKLWNTLKGIAALAQKHPNVRFIVQGDHEPILSPVAFQERFYKRFVPFIILN